ncbi:MAG: fibronectin type III domain-containing protein [Oscillospiraceae bacterium]|nr:fibronectin type III domain-containing protein [Oscillospiraceae bacterium]
MKRLITAASALLMITAVPLLPASDKNAPVTAISASAATGTKKTAKTTKLPAPKGLSYSSGKKGSILLTWEKTEGAEAYAVYQYDSKKSKWIRLTITQKTGIQINDIRSGKKYYFKVAALDKRDGKYYLGKYSKSITVQYNYETTASGKGVSNSALLTTSEQQTMLSDYYTKNLGLGSELAKSMNVVSSCAVIANVQSSGGNVMLVKHTYADGNYIIYGYCISGRNVVPVGSGAIASSQTKYGRDAYFVKEVSGNGYYIYYVKSDVSNLTEEWICKADVTGLIPVYRITVYGGGIVYLNDEESDSGAYNELMKNFIRAETGSEEITILK